MKRNYIIMSGILCIATFLTIALGVDGHFFSQVFRPISQATTSSATEQHGYVGQAISLLRTGTFNNGGPGYIGIMIRGPGYSLILASIFLLFGEVVGAIYLVNFIFFLGSVIILWRVSRFFFDNGWEFLPSLMLALFWGVISQVWIASYEMYVLFIALASILLFLKYRASQKIFWLILGSTMFGLWMTERPITLYFYPFMLALLVSWDLYRISKKQILGRVLIFTIIAGLIVGSWSLRDYRALGTWQLGSGGHSVLRRSTQVDFSRQEIISAFLSFSVGDLIGSLVYNSFPSNRKPLAWDPRVEDRWYQTGWYVHDLDGSVLTRTELDKKMYQEAFANMKRRPIKFLLTGILELSRLNAPLNHRGQEMMHTFAGAPASKTFASVVKISLIFLFRFVWYLLLAVVFYGIVRRGRALSEWSIIIALVLYYNGMYALLTHAEGRYILTVMPLYFMFFTDVIKNLFEKYEIFLWKIEKN